MMALENDLSVPGLEVRGTYGHVQNLNNNNNNNNSSSDQSCIKVEEFVGINNNNNNGNNWEGESFKMGELDWEGLLANVSSLPYLDFQIQ